MEYKEIIDQLYIAQRMIRALPAKIAEDGRLIKEEFLAERRALVDAWHKGGGERRLCTLQFRVRLRNGCVAFEWQVSKARRKTPKGMRTIWASCSISRLHEYTTEMDRDLVTRTQAKLQKLADLRSHLVDFRKILDEAIKNGIPLLPWYDDRDYDQYPTMDAPKAGSADLAPIQQPANQYRPPKPRTPKLIRPEEMPAIKPRDY